MKFTALEIAFFRTYLTQTGEKDINGNPVSRTFPDGEIFERAVVINKKIMECVDGDKFVDSELELSSDEKKLLLSIFPKEWGVNDAEFKTNIEGKLK